MALQLNLDLVPTLGLYFGFFELWSGVFLALTFTYLRSSLSGISGSLVHTQQGQLTQEG